LIKFDLVDPIALVNVSRDIAVGRKRPTWAHQTLQEAEGHAAPHGTFRESKRPQRYPCYVAAMSHNIDSQPSCYEEAPNQAVWKDAMMEEYQSIMKNDVWDIVPRPEWKFVVTSKWIYKIKHTIDGSIEKHKTRFVAKGFSQVEGIDYEETFSLCCSIHFYPDDYFPRSIHGLETTSDGCEDNLSQWRN
jgi:hypothetical protein